MSDSNMSGAHGFVIGTAGHIDHGKTAVIHALTGIDTDRLAEEKRRGISIDLGFAHLALPDGRDISFIDVPGHERFVKNMLAGAAGIQAVLLVVAADESVKPQTREHFDICRLLGIKHGIIVLTKADLASPDQIAETTEDIKTLCAGSFLEHAPIVTVSAYTGRGLSDLKNAIAHLADEARSQDEEGLARLPIDRSFTLKGFGTVITGTMWSGRLAAGDTVQIHPSKREARVRGLQVHGNKVEVAVAGQRTAVNLAGVDHLEIRRGCVLTHRDGLEATKLIDVCVDWLQGIAVPEKRELFLFHSGTAETSASLKVLKRGRASSKTFARLWLGEPTLAVPGDRFVIRKPSPTQTVGGGSIIDTFPPARLNRVRTLARLELLAQADSAKRVAFLIEEGANGQALADLVRFTGLRADVVKSLIGRNPRLVFVDHAQRAVSKLWIEQTREKVLAWLRDFHAKNPAAPGAPIALARSHLEPSLATIIFEGFSAVRVRGDVVALATHSVQVSSDDTQALSKIERGFRQAGFQPPPPSEILRSAGLDEKKGRGLLEALIKTQKLVRVSEDLIFHCDVFAHIRKSLASQKGRKFSVPEFKEWTHVSRKYAIPLLEYLDRQHVTRREGDVRIVL
jgi:selenocysteine-specific elongation factor